MKFFGASLDPDEGVDSMKKRVQLALSGYKVVEPYDAVVKATQSWVCERDVTFKAIKKASSK